MCTRLAEDAMLRLAAFATVLLGAAAKDPCECLNWKEVYDSGRALCGEGRELANLSWPMGALEYGKAVLNNDYAYQFVCDAVYKKMDNNYCTNWNLHKYGWTAEDLHPKTVNYSHSADRPHWRGLEQWCYVDAKCKDEMVQKVLTDKDSVPTWPKLLGPFLRQWMYDFVEKYLHFPRKIRRDVAVKICKKEKDTRLWDMNPMKVLEMGAKAGMRTATLTKMAYATVRDSGQVIEIKLKPLWMDIAPHVKNHSLRGLPDYIQKAIRNKVCIVIDNDCHRHDDSQRIICGNELYKLNSQCNRPDLRLPDGHCALKLDGREWQNYSRGEDIPWTE